MIQFQLKDKDGHLSPVLRFHSDEEEIHDFINKWRDELLLWATGRGTPLQRLEVETAICDLIHKVGEYYLNNTSDEVKADGKIQSWMTLWTEVPPQSIIFIINLYK